MSVVFNAADVQGNIVRGYRKTRVRYLVLEVADQGAARRWLGDSISRRDPDVPQITTEESWTVKPDTCFNIGLTYAGLVALGTPHASLATFPTEFIEGMSARAKKLGDVGASAPDNWPAPFSEPERFHLVATIYADEVAQLDQVQERVLGGGQAWNLLGTRDGCAFDDDGGDSGDRGTIPRADIEKKRGNDYVHFGYRDNISQPRFAEIHDPEIYADGQPMAPLGTVLLGYPTNFEGLVWRVPQPEPLGLNGTFNAFRVLAQDVAGFERYLDTAASELLTHPDVGDVLAPGAEAAIGEGLSRHAALREVVAANMCGRWRNGVPLSLSPDTPNPVTPVDMTDFDYGVASRCPYGAHIRRCNPRGGQIVQRVANNSRRLVRRGMPFGPRYDPTKPDTKERGLLGNFIGANLGAQFEAMSCDWLNLGLHDPRVTGSNDPLVGANDPQTSWFDLPLKSGGTIKLRGLPRFVETRGGAYTFLPSLPAIRYLAAMNG